MNRPNRRGREVVNQPMLIDGVLVKRCTTCGLDRPATSDHFTLRKRVHDGGMSFRAQCRKCYRGACARRVERSPEKQRLAARKCYERKRTDYLARSAQWHATHARTPKCQAANRVRSYLWRSLRKHATTGAKPGAMRWLPYSTDELAAHLERQFAPGMGWQNMGAWHIDHVRPVASFRFSSQTDDGFKACWSLSNLQPLWAAENMRKGARVFA
jgi:hypothetical protein